MTLALIGIASMVMVTGGLLTLRSPNSLMTALRARGGLAGTMLATPSAVRVIGVAEIAVGVAAVADIRGAAFALGLGFVAYAWFTEGAMRRSAPCGCLGAVATPATRSHAVVDLVLGIAVILAAWHDPVRPGWQVTTILGAIAAVGASSILHLLRAESSRAVPVRAA